MAGRRGTPETSVVVVAPPTPVYAGPDPDADVVSHLHAGDRVTVELGTNGRWGRIVSDRWQGDFVRVARMQRAP